jgi:pimeloyl-ACP methyl ester carboxylesterase
MRNFHPIVMVAHGINTHGTWQKTALEVFADAKITTRAFEKYISVPAFLMPWKRKERVALFLEWYGTKVSELHLDLDDPFERPSIVAHSFGTWFVSQCMLKHPEVRADKLNECGWGDVWAGMVRRAVPRTGPSGRVGFKQLDVRGLSDHPYEEFEHSDYFYKQHMAEWVKVISRRPCDLRVLHGADVESGYVATLDQTHLIDVANFKEDPAFLQADVPRGLSSTWISTPSSSITTAIRRATLTPCLSRLRPTNG